MEDTDPTSIAGAKPQDSGSAPQTDASGIQIVVQDATANNTSTAPSAAPSALPSAAAPAKAPQQPAASVATSTIVSVAHSTPPAHTAVAPAAKPSGGCFSHNSAASEAAEQKRLAASKEYDATEHLSKLTELAALFPDSRINAHHVAMSKGLSSQEAAARLLKYGPNALTPPKQLPEWLKFLLLFTDTFMILLQLAGWFCILASGLLDWDRVNLTLGIVLFLVVILTVIMNYMQARQTASVMAGFRNMMPDKATVIRDGRLMERDPADLVVGDIIQLKIGKNAPADARILASTDLKADFSSLTGESDAIRMGIESQHKEPQESKNLIFSSSGIVEGEGYGLVIRTGDTTMIGKIASLASSTNTQGTTMEREIHSFVKFVAILASVSAIIFFAIGAIRSDGSRAALLNVFINAGIVVLVANVPEGLPATVTTCLTITAQRMGKRNVFIKKVDIIETLGSATVICSDKTGTLTQNKMSVVGMWYNRASNEIVRRAKPLQAFSMLSNSLHGTIGRSHGAGSTTIGRSQGSYNTTIGRGTSTRVRHTGTINKLGAGAGLASDVTINPALLDPAYAMTIGRRAVFDGEGRITAEKQKAVGGTAVVAEAAIMRAQSFYGSFSSFGAFSGAAGVPQASWKRSNPYMRMVIMAGVCNKASRKITEEPENTTSVAVPTIAEEIKLDGDASDQGLYRFVDTILPVEMLRLLFQKKYEIPFNSTNKWSYAVVCDPEDSHSNIAFMKGAPEVILTKCTHYLYNGEERPIDKDFEDDQQAAYERFGFLGQRVLGFAFKAFPARDEAVYRNDETSTPKDKLVYAGLVALMDPPKDSVDAAIDICHAADIGVTMVTGDHPLTAEAIARKVNIITGRTAREVAAEDGVDEDDISISDPRVEAVVFSGKEIREKLVTPAQWDAVLSKPEVVFARTTPQQKLIIVENYQRRGEIVAVTGDGVNDSPALKRADIGVAMAISGSAVAKAASDIMLMDDNFASIVNAIEEGRLLFDNLKKSIAYTLAHLWPELLPVFLNVAFSFPLALPGLIILIIDLFQEQGPAVSFAYEKAEGSIMQRPPRDQKRDRLVSRNLLMYSYVIAGSAEMICAMFAYFMVYVYHGIPIANLAFSADTYFKDGAPDFIVGSRVYSQPEQMDIYQESVSAWYATLVACQFWHVWLCKTRIESIFVHGLFDNFVTIMGVAISVVLLIACVYVPFLQYIFFTYSLSGVIWPINLVFLVVMLSFTEFTKYMVRTSPQSWWAKFFGW